MVNNVHPWDSPEYAALREREHTLRVDLAMLEKSAAKKEAALRNAGTYDDVLEFTGRAVANLECISLFPDVNPHTFLDAAYALQARAWMRVHGLVS